MATKKDEPARSAEELLALRLYKAASPGAPLLADRLRLFVTCVRAAEYQAAHPGLLQEAGILPLPK